MSTATDDAKGRGIACAPLLSGETLVAVIEVVCPDGQELDGDELARLEDLCHSAGLGFRNAQLFELVERGKRDWERTFDAITDTLAKISPDFVLERVNKFFANERGFEPADLVGKKCYEALYARNRRCPGCPLARAVKSGTVATGEITDADRGSIYQVQIFPIADDAGNVESVVESARDVTPP